MSAPPELTPFNIFLINWRPHKEKPHSGEIVPSLEPAWLMLADCRQIGVSVLSRCLIPPTPSACCEHRLRDSHPLSIPLSFVTVNSLSFLKLAVSLSRQPPLPSPDGCVCESHRRSHYQELLPRMPWQ